MKKYVAFCGVYRSVLLNFPLCSIGEVYLAVRKQLWAAALVVRGTGLPTVGSRRMFLAQVSFCHHSLCLICFMFVYFVINRVPTPPGKSWKLNKKVLESTGKMSLKVMHFSSGSNGKQAAIV